MFSPEPYVTAAAWSYASAYAQTRLHQHLHPRPLKGGVQSVALQPWQAELSVLAVGLNFGVLNVLGEYLATQACLGSIVVGPSSK